MSEQSPAFSILERLRSQQAPGELPESVPGENSGGEVTIPDTLADSLANANKHLRMTLRTGAPIDDDAAAQLRVFAQLIESAQEGPPPQSPVELPGGLGPPAVPGMPNQAAAGLPGLPGMSG